MNLRCGASKSRALSPCRFYQHLPQGCEWAFGLVWGHSVSTDLIHWQHLPHAVVPTAGTLDADGCFSGCATVDTDGTPIILYTGVRLRTNVDGQPLPPPECDLHLPFIEAQLYAVPRDPGEQGLGWGGGGGLGCGWGSCIQAHFFCATCSCPSLERSCMQCLGTPVVTAGVGSMSAAV